MAAWTAALLSIASASPEALTAAPAFDVGAAPAFVVPVLPGSTAPSLGTDPITRSAIALASAHDVVPPPVTIEMEHSGKLYLDHNAPCTEGPRSAYVAFKVTNYSASTVTGLTASISGFTSSIMLGGGQGAQQYIGALSAGETRYLYWFVAYDCVIGQSAALTFSVTNAADESTDEVFVLTTEGAQSASAGGTVSTWTLGPGAIAGQVITLETLFTFGSYKAGGDFELQPAGNPSFNAGCFQLVGSLITSSEVNSIPVGTANQIHFVASSNQGGNSHEVGVRFYFRYNCTGVNSTANPYVMQADPGKRGKYTGDFDDGAGGGGDPPPVFPPGDDPAATFTTALSVTPSDTFGGASVLYRVAIVNTSTFDATIDSISVTLPAGIVYDSLAPGSAVTVGNAGELPVAGATGTIWFRGVPRPPGSTPPAEFGVGANDSLILLFRATATATPGYYTTTTSSYAGTAELPLASATLRMRPLANLSVALTGTTTPVAGDTIELVVTVANAGPHAADTLDASLTLPTGFALVSTTGSATLFASTLSWPTRHDLAVGASLVDTVLVRFDSLGAHDVVADVSTPTSVDTAQADNSATLSMTVQAPAVAVTPDGLATPSRRLAGTGYSQRFVVFSDFGRVETFDLLAAVRAPATFLSLDSMTVDGVLAPAADSARPSLGAHDSVEVRVWYTVAAGAPGQDVIDLLGRSLTYPAASRDTGWAEIRRVRPELSLLRAVSPAVVLPGTVLTHQLSLGNPGESDATGVVLSEALPDETEFELGSIANTLPAGVSAAVSYSQDGGATWTYTPASGACGAAAGYDGCVDTIRWEFTGDFTAGAPSGSGLLEFRVRVP